MRAARAGEPPATTHQQDRVGGEVVAERVTGNTLSPAPPLAQSTGRTRHIEEGGFLSSVMREITLEVQGRSGELLELQVTTDTTPMLRLTLPALDPAELSSPAASFLRLNRDPANNVLRFLCPEDWLELEGTSRVGRIAVGGSACWRQELGGKVAYLARRRALFSVSRGFEVGWDHQARLARVSNFPQEFRAINRASAPSVGSLSPCRLINSSKLNKVPLHSTNNALRAGCTTV